MHERGIRYLLETPDSHLRDRGNCPEMPLCSAGKTHREMCPLGLSDMAHGPLELLPQGAWGEARTHHWFRLGHLVPYPVVFVGFFSTS